MHIAYPRLETFQITVTALAGLMVALSLTVFLSTFISKPEDKNEDIYAANAGRGQS